MFGRTRGFCPALVAAPVLIAAASHARATQLLVPAYFDPDDGWTELTAAAASGAPITAIVNPASGPGKSADSSYTAAITSFEAAGGTVLAYVPTAQTKDSLASVESEINTYESFYPVEGFFVDQMTSGSKSADLNYYSNLYSYIKGQSPSYEVIGNPGTNVPQSYAAVADTLVTYEDVGSNYAANQAESWTASAPANEFANIAYEVPDAATMRTDLAQAQSQNVGFVYFTDDGADGNPYDSLPSYFQAEVAAVPEPGMLAFAAMAAGAGLMRRSRRSRPG